MPEITTNHYLVLSFIVFTIGLVGIVARRNMITVLMSIELVLNSVNLNFIAFSHQLADLTGQIFTVFTITVAAGEAAVGLGILVALYRLGGSRSLFLSADRFLLSQTVGQRSRDQGFRGQPRGRPGFCDSKNRSEGKTPHPRLPTRRTSGQGCPPSPAQAWRM